MHQLPGRAADALANAGRGPEAAPEYLELGASKPPGPGIGLGDVNLRRLMKGWMCDSDPRNF